MTQKYRNLTLATALCLAATIAHAAVYTWSGSADGDWNNASNWDANGVPATDGNGSIVNTANTIVITNGLNAPSINLPSIPTATSESAGPPLFDIASGVSLSLQGFTHQILFTSVDKTAVTVASGGSLTIATAISATLAEEIYLARTGGTQTFDVAGTLTLDAGLVSNLHLANQQGRNSVFNLDGGTVNVVAGTIFGSRSNAGDFTSLYNQINLANGSTFNAPDSVLRNTAGAVAGSTMVVDIQDTGSSFIFASGRDFTSIAGVEAGFGSVFISSTLGNGNLQVTEDGGVFTVTAVPEPSAYALMLGVVVFGCLMIRRRVTER